MNSECDAISKTVFDALSEKIDQVVLGRRYIIAEIGKLKVSVEDFKGAIEKANFQSIADAVTEMKNFMQMAVSSLGQLKSTLTQLGNTVANLSTTVDDTLGAVNQLRSRGSGAPIVPTPSRSVSAPVPSTFGAGPSAFSAAPPPPQPSSAASGYPRPSDLKAFSAPPPPAPSFAPPAPAGSLNRFDNILNDAKAGTTAKDLGGDLDTLRSQLSKENPLNPVLFELSMEAGRLKSLGGKSLTGADLSGFEIKVNSWKQKSGG
jgi:hypothetical protein